MLDEIELMHKEDGDTEVMLIQQYATRFARKCLLEHLCQQGHNVLTIENKLVEETKNQMHEYFLKNGWNEDEVKSKIRQYAIRKALYLTNDNSILDIVCNAIQKSNLDDIFPEIN